jgi:hypothetical protein
MSKLVKDFIEIRDVASLDALIERLTEIRESMPETARPEVKMRGDDTFGRKLSIAYFRPQTPEEAESDARCHEAYRAAKEQELTRLQDELGFCPVPQRRTGKLRIVA